MVLTACFAGSADAQEVGFRPLEIWVDVEEGSLAAWQLEVTFEGDAKIVGVERGDSAAFSDPPYYDPAALRGGRIVLAAFTTTRALAPGRHKVAVIHLMESGPPVQYDVRLIVASDARGEHLPATASVE